MRFWTHVARAIGAAAVAGVVSVAEAAEVGLYKVDVGGRIRAVRAADVDGDGKKDLLVLHHPTGSPGGARNAILVLRTPAAPVPGTFFDVSKPTVVACDGDAAGPRASAGAVAVGRFGEKGAVRLLFLGPDGATDLLAADGGAAPAARPPGPPSLLVRGPGEDVVFWDAVADLDGDGLDECWFPDADGRMVVRGGTPAGDAVLGARATLDLSRDEASAFVRKWNVPSLVPADFDGDGKTDLASLEGNELVVRRRADAGWVEARVALPFLQRPADLPAQEVRAPRVAIADVDRDGKADLLVTMVQGRADKIGALRTVLYHYAGPLLPSPTLPPPRTRIDTESVSLHPRFRDVDGDGRLDYVGDSIRGNVIDLIQRIMGKEPEITFTAYRFDPAAGTFEGAPYATFARPYSGAEARGNRFGQSGWFDGDFDKDGHADFLDLGNLTGVEILGGARGGTVAAGGRGSFDRQVLRPVRIPGGRLLATDALVTDLNADGASDAVLWTDPRAPRGDGPEGLLFLVVPK